MISVTFEWENTPNGFAALSILPFLVADDAGHPIFWPQIIRSLSCQRELASVRQMEECPCRVLCRDLFNRPWLALHAMQPISYT